MGTKIDQPSMWIVTGSSGFLGTEVCTMMTKKGYEVLGLDKNPPSYSPEWETVESDFSEYEKYLTGQSFGIIHCAALKTVRDSEANEEVFMHNNLEKSINLFSSAQRNGCRNFVFVSSAAVYAESDVRISEIHSTKPKSVYGKSKLLFESYILDSKIFEQSSIVVIRPFNIVGRNTQKMRSESVISKILDCIASEEKFEFRTTSDNETPIRDYIDVTDVSELIVRSATFQKEAGLIIVNACTGRGTNLRELIAECENIAIGMNTQNGMRLNTEKKSLSESEILNSIGDPSSANLKFDWFARISLKESILMEYR